jgi:hypothetical protein
MQSWRLYFILAFGLISASSAAEYRVFLLKIQMPGQDGGKLIQSTLDPEQYRGYYPLPDGATVTYVQTWRCWGRTGLRPLCKNPKEMASESDTATPPVPPPATPSETPKKGLERSPASTCSH